MNPEDRTRVAIESPYAGQTGDKEEIERNETFARRVCRFAVKAGYSPYAMHLFFPQFLEEQNPRERTEGIESGLAWTDQAEEIWQCTRPAGRLTRGMRLAHERYFGEPEEVANSDRKLRRLFFTQKGRLVGGWEGPLAQPARPLVCGNQELEKIAGTSERQARKVARRELERRSQQKGMIR